MRPGDRRHRSRRDTSCRRRSRPGDEQGFSLVEGLVVTAHHGRPDDRSPCPGSSARGARRATSRRGRPSTPRTSRSRASTATARPTTSTPPRCAGAEPAIGEAHNLRVQASAAISSPVHLPHLRRLALSRGREGGGTFTQESGPCGTGDATVTPACAHASANRGRKWPAPRRRRRRRANWVVSARKPPATRRGRGAGRYSSRSVPGMPSSSTTSGTSRSSSSAGSAASTSSAFAA